MKLLRRATVAGLVVLSALPCSFPVFASEFPDRPVKLVVPFSAGSTNDIVARAISDKLQAALGQPVVVENVAGAGGTLAAGRVAKAPPDGHTLLVASSGHTISPFTMAKLPYDTLGELKSITMLSIMPVVLVVSPQSGFNTVKELVAHGKSRPNALTFASAGAGSSTHLNAERFRVESGFEAVHVPFKGTPDAMREIVGGRIDYMFVPLAAALPLLQNGRLRALAVGAPQRLPQLPNVPTTGESGTPDYSFWIGLLAPSKTPAPVVNRLHQEVSKVLALPEVRARFDAINTAPKAMSPTEMDTHIRDELTANEQIVKAAKIVAN